MNPPLTKTKHRKRLNTMKLLTVTVPCYNSAAYMERCINSLLPGGEEMDILIIDDGSTDETGAIADRYARECPTVVRVIHQENGGHGEGINQGLRNALGCYFKVVDSDDRLDAASLGKLLGALRRLEAAGETVDLIVNNYVYDRADKQSVFSVNYRVAMKPGRVLTWEDIRRFPVHKQFMIHSMIYRTALLREHGLTLPAHLRFMRITSTFTCRCRGRSGYIIWMSRCTGTLSAGPISPSRKRISCGGWIR